MLYGLNFDFRTMVKEHDLLKPHILYEYQQSFIFRVPNKQIKKCNLPAISQKKYGLALFFFCLRCIM